MGTTNVRLREPFYVYGYLMQSSARQMRKGNGRWMDMRPERVRGPLLSCQMCAATAKYLHAPLYVRHCRPGLPSSQVWNATRTYMYAQLVRLSIGHDELWRSNIVKERSSEFKRYPLSSSTPISKTGRTERRKATVRQILPFPFDYDSAEITVPVQQVRSS